MIGYAVTNGEGLPIFANDHRTLRHSFLRPTPFSNAASSIDFPAVHVHSFRSVRNECAAKYLLAQLQFHTQVPTIMNPALPHIHTRARRKMDNFCAPSNYSGLQELEVCTDMSKRASLDMRGSDGSLDWTGPCMRLYGPTVV